MGTRTDAAERQVEEQRRLIERRVGDLSERVRGDISELKSTTSERASTIADRLPGSETVAQRVAAYPAASMMGGLGLGVALGLMSEGMGSGGTRRTASEEYEIRRMRERFAASGEASQGSRSGGGAASGGLVAGIVMQGLQTVLGPLQDQLQEALREAFSGGEQRTAPPAGPRASEAPRAA